MTSEQSSPAPAPMHDAKTLAAELMAAAKKATRGPWIRSGVRQKLRDADCIMVGPDGFLIYAVPIGHPKEHAGAFADAGYLALCSPDNLHDYQARVIPAESKIVELEARIGSLETALRSAESAIAEFHRYWHGGETRGSYDGRPERDGLWRALQAARSALARTAGGKDD